MQRAGQPVNFFPGLDAHTDDAGKIAGVAALAAHRYGVVEDTVGDLARGVHGVVAADVDEVAHVVGAKDIKDAVEILLLAGLELVATGADAPRRRSHT